jgi:hypothetical protein
MEQPINEPFTSEESQEIYQNFKTIINSRLDKLYNSKGLDGEQYAYSIAVKQMRKKQAEKLAEPTTEEPMEQGDKLKEMIQSVLSKPLNEKKKSFPDLTGDGKVTKADILKARGVELDEDLDLGHQDDEPHMLKADLYRIGKYAMELYKMVDQFEDEQEVDFPHWWQSKIIKAKDMLISAKHYLDFEIKEPQLDAMVDVASEEGAIDETVDKTNEFDVTLRNGKRFSGVKFINKNSFTTKEGGSYIDQDIATSEMMKKIKEAILAKLKK